MIKVNAKTTDTGKQDMAKLQKELERLNGSFVSIGITEDAGQYEGGPLVVEVALWNEFGTQHMPERSFFRSAIDENMSKIEQLRERLLQQIMEGKTTVDKALASLGFQIQVMIQNKIKSNVPPALAPSTAAHKNREGVAPMTLIETGLMLRSVTFKVTMA